MSATGKPYVNGVYADAPSLFNEGRLGAGHVIHLEFTEAAKRDPDGIALVFEGHHLSYAALDAASNRLARRLLERGVGVEEIVAISAERSVELIVGILAILKAGAAYLPLDPGYPRDRLHYMLLDSGARLVLVGDDQSGTFGNLGVDEMVLRLDANAGPVDALPVTRFAAPENLAYLIYTSGSTGRPKGIMVPHRAVVNHVRWRSEHFALNRTDRTLQRTPISFDISVWEIFSALITGGTLVLPRPGAQKESACLVDAIIEGEVTNFQIVPSMLKLMLQEPKIGRCRSLRCVFSGGEVLSGDLASKFQSSLGATLVNVYGPTETTIDTTFHVCASGAEMSSIPIGHPIASTSAFVLESEGRRAPATEEGMLFIGGLGLARGYWRRADRTAESFVPNAFSADAAAGERLYNTGDLVRVSRQGDIEFIGRKDSQVKVRGFRIELQEIEHALKACPLVADGLAMIRTGPGGDKKIVCYYLLKVSENSIVVNAFRHTRYHEIRDYLASRLPDYMVPHHLVNVDGLPLLPNGKVNTKALPEPAYYLPGGGKSDQPRNEKEQLLAQVWCDVLAVPTVACEDLFAYYGGDSLQMIQVRLLAQQRGLFVNPSLRHYSATVRSLADHAVWMTEHKLNWRERAADLRNAAKLYWRAKKFELLDIVRQRRTARLEAPDRRRFREFYEGLENKRDIYYLFVRTGLLHWAAKQLEFVPPETNVVIVGSALSPEEQVWIGAHIDRPFFNTGLEIDDNAVWEFLFETNQHNFGWLEIGCFVNNSGLFGELARMEDDVAFNCIYTHTERHRRTFVEYLLFVNIRAIRALAARKIKIYPSRYSYNGMVRKEHAHAWHRVPRGRDRALVRRMLHREMGAAPGGIQALLASHNVFELYFFICHLFYLHVQQLGFRMKRVRHLTAPTHVNYHNFFSDEVIVALHLSRYEAIYRTNGPKFDSDLEMTLQADYLVLRSMISHLPPAYARRLWDLEVKILGRGLQLEDAAKNVVEYMVRFSVSPQVFERPPWRFLNEQPLESGTEGTRLTPASM